MKNDVEEVASATTDFYDSLKTTYNPNYDYEKLTSQKAVKNDGKYVIKIDTSNSKLIRLKCHVFK